MARFPTIRGVRFKKVRLPSGNNVFFNAQGFATFDKSVLKTNWKRINPGPLKRAGLLTRKIMRRSIRRVKSDDQRVRDFSAGKTKTLRRGKPSKIGTPPRSRDAKRGHPFKLIYSLPYGPRAVVVGHVGWGGVSVTPMEAHEFGKTVSVRYKVYPKKKRRKMSAAQRREARKKYITGELKSKEREGKVVTKSVKMPKRPFAKPALKEAQPYFAAMWKNAVSSIGSVHN